MTHALKIATILQRPQTIPASTAALDAMRRMPPGRRAGCRGRRGLFDNAQTPDAPRLEAVDTASIAHIAGIVEVVVIKDFVGVVAEREENAIKAARALRVTWKHWDALPDMTDLASVLRAIPDKVRVLKESGDVARAMQGQRNTLKATYIWPYQMHGSIGPSCGVADFKDGFLTVWTGSQNPHALHSDLAVLLELPEDRIRVVRMEAAGCYGHNCADDATAAFARGRPPGPTATDARGRTRLGAERHGPVDGGGRCADRRRYPGLRLRHALPLQRVAAAGTIAYWPSVRRGQCIRNG